MTLTVSYTIFDNVIVKENRSGVESFYNPDTLGSTSQLTDASGNVTDSYAYWPYGEVRTHTGSSKTPYTYVGTLGYYFDSVMNWFYVRARYYLSNVGRWLTIDPLWPGQHAYGYGLDNPIANSDPSGLFCYSFTTRFGKASYWYHKSCWTLGMSSLCMISPPCQMEWDTWFISRFEMPYVPVGGIAGITACIKGCKKLGNGLGIAACTILCGLIVAGGASLIHGCVNSSGDSCVKFTPDDCFSGTYSCCPGGGFGDKPTGPYSTPPK